MKPSTELFDLIKSLSTSEKRYFKLNASIQKGNKNYLKLFEAIDSQKVYVEELIKNKFRKEKFIVQLPFTKNYLYNLIFRSLNSFYNEKSINARLNNMLSRCKFLYEKALFKQFFKVVKLGKDLALRYERFYHYLQFLEMEKQLVKKEELFKREINKIYEEETLVLEKIKNISWTKLAVSNLFKIYKTNGIMRSASAEKSISDIIPENYFQNRSKTSTVRSMENFHMAMYLASELRGDSKKSYYYCEKRFHLISANAEIFDNLLIDQQKDSLRTLISSALNYEKFPEASKLYDRYFKLLSRSGIDILNGALTEYNILLISSVHFRQKEAEDEIHSIGIFLEKNVGKITVNTENYFNYNLAKYFLIIENFENALKYINKLLERRALRLTPEYESYARLLNVIIHFELHNHKLLKFLLSSTEKYLKAKNKLFRFEKVILDFIKSVSGIEKKEIIYKKYVELQKDVLKLKKDKYEVNAFKYFDILAWVEKKIDEMK